VGVEVSVAGATIEPPRRRFVHVLGGLTAVNVLVNGLTLVTGPLQARLLGPQGRGELALVLVVTGFAPIIVSLGLGTFLAREISQTQRRGVLLGTVIVVSVALGVLGAICAYPVSRLFGHGHRDVQTLIFVGLLTLPVAVAGLNLSGAYWGSEDWRWFSAMRVLPPLLIAGFYVALAAFGAFTVVTASVAVFAAGLLALLPVLPLLRATRGWGFDRDLAKRAVGFGGKYSLSAVANQGNLRVDQLFIASFVSARELGFYVVAGSLASATLMVSQALNLMVVPMVATGDHHAVRRILRITLAGMTLAAAALAVVAGPFVHIVFGRDFTDSVGLARILCFGSVFIAGKGIVSAALVGDGRPGETAVVEVATFVALIPALVLVVPSLGAPGAAVVVVLASAAGFGALVARARRRLGGRLAEYLVPTPADAGWLIAMVGRRRSELV
jgi:O-antigen/teichoic acid export membrane protein